MALWGSQPSVNNESDGKANSNQQIININLGEMGDELRRRAEQMDRIKQSTPRKVKGRPWLMDAPHKRPKISEGMSSDPDLSRNLQTAVDKYRSIKNGMASVPERFRSPPSNLIHGDSPEEIAALTSWLNQASSAMSNMATVAPQGVVVPFGGGQLPFQGYGNRAPPGLPSSIVSALPYATEVSNLRSKLTAADTAQVEAAKKATEDLTKATANKAKADSNTETKESWTSVGTLNAAVLLIIDEAMPNIGNIQKQAIVDKAKAALRVMSVDPAVTTAPVLLEKAYLILSSVADELPNSSLESVDRATRDRALQKAVDLVTVRGHRIVDGKVVTGGTTNASTNTAANTGTNASANTAANTGTDASTNTAGTDVNQIPPDNSKFVPILEYIRKLDEFSTKIENSIHKKDGARFFKDDQGKQLKEEWEAFKVRPVPPAPDEVAAEMVEESALLVKDMDALLKGVKDVDLTDEAQYDNLAFDSRILMNEVRQWWGTNFRSGGNTKEGNDRSRHAALIILEKWKPQLLKTFAESDRVHHQNIADVVATLDSMKDDGFYSHYKKSREEINGALETSPFANVRVHVPIGDIAPTQADLDKLSADLEKAKKDLEAAEKKAAEDKLAAEKKAAEDKLVSPPKVPPAVVPPAVVPPAVVPPAVVPPAVVPPAVVPPAVVPPTFDKPDPNDVEANDLIAYSVKLASIAKLLPMDQKLARDNMAREFSSKYAGHKFSSNYVLNTGLLSAILATLDLPPLTRDHIFNDQFRSPTKSGDPNVPGYVSTPDFYRDNPGRDRGTRMANLQRMVDNALWMQNDRGFSAQRIKNVLWSTLQRDQENQVNHPNQVWLIDEDRAQIKGWIQKLDERSVALSPPGDPAHDIGKGRGSSFVQPNF
jgi:hypothetical protein